jgi:hypothetical protein
VYGASDSWWVGVMLESLASDRALEGGVLVGRRGGGVGMFWARSSTG